MTKRTTKKKIKAKARTKSKTVVHPKWKHAVVYLHALVTKCTCGAKTCENQPISERVMCNLWKAKLVAAETPFAFCTVAIRELEDVHLIMKMLDQDPSLRNADGVARPSSEVCASFVSAIRSMFMITEPELVELAKRRGWNGRQLVKLPAPAI